ncbi:unnamed protein product [Cylicocyclus nassatus]|uniref:Uncharacterized protein n=1 Tax=Cylicocyclus nassatus TaxID=53992 RepID=A0AA36HD14_CYLNA|nr:unnamed protein product [Cylicocyclus nassatus]
MDADVYWSSLDIMTRLKSCWLIDMHPVYLTVLKMCADMTSSCCFARKHFSRSQGAETAEVKPVQGIILRLGRSVTSNMEQRRISDLYKQITLVNAENARWNINL